MHESRLIKLPVNHYCTKDYKLCVIVMLIYLYIMYTYMFIG